MMTLNPSKTKAAAKKAAKAPKNKKGAAKSASLRLVVRDQDLHNLEREAELIRLRQRVAALEANAKAKKPLPPRHGSMWESYEEDILRRAVASGVLDFRVIAEKIGRTPFAVFARAIKINVITEGNCYRIWEASVAPSPEELAATVNQFNDELRRLLQTR